MSERQYAAEEVFVKILDRYNDLFNIIFDEDMLFFEIASICMTEIPEKRQINYIFLKNKDKVEVFENYLYGENDRSLRASSVLIRDYVR